MGLLTPLTLQYQQQQQIISACKAWILSRCRPSACILFGSAARGEMNESSDIDIALIFSDAEKLAAARNALYETPPLTELWPCDLVFFTVTEYQRKLERGGLCELVSSEGILLHGRWP
ncbi:MAG: nucleotidyltransferase domain-containing protein [Spirochaetia bacterium]|nr:nucleotidyltransferase domain-containing protein [Spirochaetia bacterium]